MPMSLYRVRPGQSFRHVAPNTVSRIYDAGELIKLDDAIAALHPNSLEPVPEGDQDPVAQ